MSDLPSLPFDLRALDVFLAICEAGSMVAAARRLGITQPSVSQTITEMEARIGVPLFDRQIRPIGLTPAGALLRQRASMLLAEARQIGPMLRRVGEGRLPFLRVGLVDSLSRALSATLAGFLAEVAEQSSLLSGLTANHTAGLITRQLDLFLGAEEVEDAEGLERHLLLQEAYIILGPATLPPPRASRSWPPSPPAYPWSASAPAPAPGWRSNATSAACAWTSPATRNSTPPSASPPPSPPGWAGPSPHPSAWPKPPCPRPAPHAATPFPARPSPASWSSSPGNGNSATCRYAWPGCAAPR
jgi:DNA-binding transcriptional LysR family regulator